MISLHRAAARSAPVAENSPSADNRAPRISWPITLVLFTLAGVLRFTYLYLDDVTRAATGTAVRRIIEEGTGAYAALLLFPIVVALERRFPLDAGRWRRDWPAHVAGLVAFSTLHTSLLAVSRSAIYLLLDRGAYDYGRMSVRYFMEAPQDVISYCAFIGILTFLRVQKHLREREVRAASLERDAANARLEVLGLRLQPHFLFNALNTISSVVYDDPAAADHLIGRLGDLLRHALRTGERQEVSVAEELDTLHAYLALVEARFGDRLVCTVRADERVSGLAIPPFLLQPLAENAVRHGSSLEFTKTKILIALSIRDDRLRVVVENDVDAAQAAVEPVRVGTGLGTTRDRLMLLYGVAGTVVTESRDGRFRVAVELPARTIEASADLAVTDRDLADVHANAHR